MAEASPKGYPEEMFVNRVSGRLKCPICLDVIRDPVFHLPCQNGFCHRCLNKVEGGSGLGRDRRRNCPMCREPFTPSVIIKDLTRSEMISELEVHCKDCPWTGTLSAMQAHEDECPSKEVECGVAGCNARIKRSEVSHHEQSCPHARIPCPHSDIGCSEVVLRSQIYHHLREECPKEREESLVSRFMAMATLLTSLTGLSPRSLQAQQGSAQPNPSSSGANRSSAEPPRLRSSRTQPSGLVIPSPASFSLSSPSVGVRGASSGQAYSPRLLRARTCRSGFRARVPSPAPAPATDPRSPTGEPLGKGFYMWKIRNFPELTASMVDSPKFSDSLGGSWWCRLYPDGDRAENRGHITIGAYRDRDATASYSITIKNSRPGGLSIQKSISCVESDWSRAGWGWQKVASRKYLMEEGFVKNGTLTIGMEVEIHHNP